MNSQNSKILVMNSMPMNNAEQEEKNDASENKVNINLNVNVNVNVCI